MPFERVTYKPVEAKPGFLVLFALMGVPSFFYGWLQSRELVVGIALAILAFLIAMVIWVLRRNQSHLSSAVEAFKQRGYNLDFQLGILLIDSKAKVLAFVLVGQHTMDYYSTRDIRQWQLQWVDKMISGTSYPLENTIVIETNNPQYPVYRVPCHPHATAQAWVARLSAIINA